MGLFDGTALERPVLCDRCSKDINTCKCPPIVETKVEPEVDPSKQRLKVRVEKRKRGKMMTVISGFSGAEKQRQETFTKLKNYCGAGGSIAGMAIEIQGDHVTRVRGYLKELGYRV